MNNGPAELLEAAVFAAEKHANQRRKDAVRRPYINHPLRVAAVLAREGNVSDTPLLIAALLHDTVEDTEATGDELAERFGETISRLVAEVTDDKSLPKERRKQMQVETAPRKSDRAKQLKIADKICNIRDLDRDSPVGWDRPRKLQYVEWARRVVDGCRGVNAALDHAFDQTVAQARHRLGETHP